MHSTAGATFVGARYPLVAFNINLDTDDVDLVRRIASMVRESSGGLPGVKALGLWMRGAGVAQVSLNLTDFEKTPIGTVFETVRSLASRAGVSVRESELVGLAPEAAFAGLDTASLQIEGFSPSKILETRLMEVGL